MTDRRVPLPGLEQLLVDIEPLALRFLQAGHRIYLVGGVVRDLAATASASKTGDRAPVGNDIDLTTDARPAEIKRLVAPVAEAVWAQGERFGTIGARVAGRALEITTHRADTYDPTSRKPVVSFGDDLMDDLSRRDFTINAAAVELPGGQLHDPHGGLADLRRRRLRTPLSPEISFSDDPLRMLRAARFLPRFDLSADPALVAAATDMADRLDIVSVERVNDELERLLAVERPRAGFDFLVATGLLRRVLPGFDQLEGVDVERAVALASTPPPTPALPPASSRAGQPPGPDEVTVRRAGLLWPIRARAGEHLARLRYSRAESDRTLNLLAGTEQGLARRPDRPTVRRIAALTGPVDLQLVKVLAANLAEVHPGIEAEGLGDLIDELSRGEDLGRLDGPLTGAEIMDLLAIGPGPEVGRAQRHLRELRLDQGPIEPDQARVELLRWWRQEPGGRSSLP